MVDSGIQGGKLLIDAVDGREDIFCMLFGFCLFAFHLAGQKKRTLFFLLCEVLDIMDTVFLAVEAIVNGDCYIATSVITAAGAVN